MTQQKSRTLIVDNYDSYTFNIFQICAQISETVIIRNDSITWDQLKPLLNAFDQIIISPGPGRPDDPKDFGVCWNILKECTEIPILGVCLGHQGLAAVHGGSVIYAPQMMHGLTSQVYHSGNGLFNNIPQGFQVVRYHSLIVDQKLPDCLELTAWSEEDRCIMGIQHKKYPHFGVQFHPESICTEFGQDLIKNFIQLSQDHWRQFPLRTFVDIPQEILKIDLNQLSFVATLHAEPVNTNQTRVLVKKIHCQDLSCFDLFQSLYKDSKNFVFLDSARDNCSFSRFSIMAGCSDGDSPSNIVQYSISSQTVKILENGVLTQFKGSIYDYIKAQLSVYQNTCCFDYETQESLELPFNFNLGFIGYLSYECLYDSPLFESKTQGQEIKSSDDVGASFMFVSKALVYDKVDQNLYMLFLDQPYQQNDTLQWINNIEYQISYLKSLQQEISSIDISGFRRNFSQQVQGNYVRSVNKCQDYIHEGDSYELCLTNNIQFVISLENEQRLFDLYHDLRNRNPAPFGSFMKFDEIGSTNQSIYLLSSSPERFMEVSKDKFISMKPIKGTIKRSNDPIQDQANLKQLINSKKDRAENLMIVDLIRNDLNQFCDPHTVSVPKMMAIESYETVHQMVTEVVGQIPLQSDLSSVDALRYCFPPGSMTGAPKKRSIEILLKIENDVSISGSKRGAYSGVHGYFSLNGSCDFSVIIRSIQVNLEQQENIEFKALLSVGAGGAITALSDPEDEFNEMLLKANSTIPSIYSVFPNAKLLQK